MSKELKITFWGVRGSYPTPGRGTVQYGGNTSSVEIQAGSRTLILDAGTGIIPLGRELVRSNRASELLILLSHLHHDHTQGFPFFVPAYLHSAKLHIFGPDGTYDSMKSVLERNQSAETFPLGLRDMASSKNIKAVSEFQLIIWDEEGVRISDSDHGLSDDALIVHVHKSHAHPGGVFIYRVTWRGKSIVYATDTEGYVGTDKRLVKFAWKTDVLIHDAQYLDEHYWGQLHGWPATQGYGHSTVTMAGEVAEAARVGQLVLFHHEPSYDDNRLAEMEGKAKRVFERSVMAYEGLEINLSLQDILIPISTIDDSRKEDVQYVQNG